MNTPHPERPTGDEVSEVFANALFSLRDTFFLPVTRLLSEQLDHSDPVVRVYAASLLCQMVITNIFVFNLDELAEILAEIKVAHPLDPDSRVRDHLSTCHHDLQKAALEYAQTLQQIADETTQHKAAGYKS